MNSKRFCRMTSAPNAATFMALPWPDDSDEEWAREVTDKISPWRLMVQNKTPAGEDDDLPF